MQDLAGGPRTGAVILGKPRLIAAIPAVDRRGDARFVKLRPPSVNGCLQDQWAERGSRPRQARDQRYENGYIFGAICPARDVGAALSLPHADGWAMQQHLHEISRHVVTGAHAVVLLDQAGWHTTDKLKEPANIPMLPLPPKSPELNAQVGRAASTRMSQP